MLYLVHHGDAVGPEVDPARPLSTRGRVEADVLAQKAAARGVKPAVIWHSGKLRAKQTAEAFWHRCNPLSTLAAARGLQPTDPPASIVDTLRPQALAPGGIMLVGHFPHLPRLLALLLARGQEAAAADFPLHGIVALEELNGEWVETWRMEPP
ncbi:MAG TPA: histidine phosphatase family protein [Vicinamibacterales bacterium]|nr:histidine phosphatase family protein [Vicinamibacterales bacterium]